MTLQIGATTATLTGKISRSGRLRAVGRRPPLATPLASFTEIEIDGERRARDVAHDGRRRLRGVAQRPAPRLRRDVDADTDADLDADTDADLDLAGRAHRRRVRSHHHRATRRSERRRPGASRRIPTGRARSGSGSVALDFATLTMATDGALSGYYVWGGDAFDTVAGSATDQSTTALARLSGSFSGFFGTYAFTMERVSEGTDSALGGTWNLTFVGGGFQPFNGTAVLDLTVPANGLATAAPTTLVRNGGMTAYTTGAGTCTVAPAGGICCMLPPAVGAGRRVPARDARCRRRVGAGRVRDRRGADDRQHGNLERDALIRQRASQYPMTERMRSVSGQGVSRSRLPRSR